MLKLRPKYCFPIAMLALCACESVPPQEATALDEDPRRGVAVDTICFSGRLSGFYKAGDQALVIRDTPKKAYLIETGFCPNLNQIEGLRLVRPDNCLRRGDRVEVYDTPLPREGAIVDRPDRCLVNSIHTWNEDQKADAEDQE